MIRGYVGATQVVTATDTCLGYGKVVLVSLKAQHTFGSVEVTSLVPVSRPHALSYTGQQRAYWYNANGNMTSGAGRTIQWDAANRPVTITLSGVTTNIAYDGEGRRIKKVETNGGTVTTTIYVGNYFEKVFVNGSANETVQHYYAGDKRIAMRRIPSGGGDGTLYYIFSDHLGGTSVTLNATTRATSTVSFYPFGASRYSTGNLQTDRLFTGARLENTIGIYEVGGRYYDPAIGRFIQPDPMGQLKLNDSAPLIPLSVSYSDPRLTAGLGQWNRDQGRIAGPLDPQLLNRYSYSRNNPETYYDPSGHFVWIAVGAIVGGAVGFGAYYFTHRDNFNWGEAAVWTGGGALLGSGAGLVVELVAGGAVAAGGTVLAGEATVGSQMARSPAVQGAFSNLYRAGQYGIQTYNSLRNAISGSGLEAHHLIEKRFLPVLQKTTGNSKLTEGQLKSIAMTPEEHQVFTNQWRALIGYIGDKNPINTATATRENLIWAIQQVYDKYPELQKAALQQLGLE